MLKKLFFLFLISLHFFSFAQLRLDTLNWRSPVDIPISLSGNFAELRSTHFHAGIDIRTNGREGYKLYAVNDGYISRIKVTPGGYGQALYITHPDGFTSVYAHLKEFNIQIEKYTRAQQYKQQSFIVDLFPDKNELTVKKGDIIGLSGNSGSSMGPHLHFEVRKTSTAAPYNGLFLGYDIKDTINPVMYNVVFYPYKNGSFVNSKNTKQTINLRKTNGCYKLANTDTVYVSGQVGIGLKVNDFINGSQNRCGVYNVKMIVNGQVYFESQFDNVPFSEARYVLSYMDYQESELYNNRLHKLFVDPNNNASVYKNHINRGILTADSNLVKNIEIITTDAAGNASKIKMVLKFTDNYNIENITNNNNYIATWHRPFVFDTIGVSIVIPKNALYDTLFFKFDIDTVLKNGNYTPFYNIHEPGVALHRPYDLKIAVPVVDSALATKLVVAKKTKNGYATYGGQLNNGFIDARPREFGSFTVIADTVSPTIEPLRALRDRTNLKGIDTLFFKVDDNLTGIVDYRATINGQWVLLQWDPKNKLMYYIVDEFMPASGNVTLELNVADERGNQTNFSQNYYIDTL